jgi:hypothetical protein
MNTLRRIVATTLAASLTITTLPLYAQPAPISGLIGTEQVAAAQLPAAATLQGERARLLATLDRADLAEGLRARGVSADELRARIGALTDAEAAELMARIDQAPAGADILGIVFTIFVVLLVTDILGFTKVFPFTRSVR